MILILDPELFLIKPNDALASEQRTDIKKALDQINLLVREGARVSLGRSEWKDFRSICVMPVLTRFNDPQLNAAWRVIEAAYIPGEAPLVPDISCWGTSQLFRDLTLNARPWRDIVSEVAVHWILQHRQVLFFCKNIIGRNIELVGAGHAVLGVKTRWVLYFSATGTPGATAVNCITSLRNVRVPWTIRYDDRLPDTAPSNGLAFFPANNWKSGRIQVQTTMVSKAVWIDSAGNGWAKPSPPNQAHHWDVYLRDLQAIRRLPVNPINITCWGTTDRNRVAGEIHHLQSVQQHLQ